MIHLFCGYDQREAIGFHVFAQSVIDRASKPVAFVPLASMGLPQGSNTFTVSRFLIPFLMGFKGRAIFADASDMLMMGDVAMLDAQFDPNYAAQVVQHPKYQTKHKVKYRGTAMECPNTDYDRKNWASLMLINCEHPTWVEMTPERITSMKTVDLLQLKGIEPIGQLSDCWNRLVDEGHYVAGANLLHWTAGVPGIPHYHDAPGAENWHATHEAMERIHGT